MPIPSIPSFFEIQEDFSPVQDYIPDRRAQTPQPLFVSLSAGNKWLPSLVLLSQTDAPINTFSGASFLCLVSEKTLQPFFFHNAIFHWFSFLPVSFLLPLASPYRVLSAGLW